MANAEKQDPGPVSLELIGQRIMEAKTVEEAQEWGLTLWYLMRDTREGWQCPGCELKACDLERGRRSCGPVL